MLVALILGAVNIIAPPTSHNGSGIIKKGLILPQRVRVLSIIKPEIVSSTASYIEAKRLMFAYAVELSFKNCIIKNSLNASTNCDKFF